MRVVFLILISFSLLPAHSQMPLEFGVSPYYQPGFSILKQTPVTSSLNKKWQLSTFSGLSTGYSFMRTGNIGVVSAPVGLQLTRRLNSNWYAFAGLSAAPALLSFNSSFMNPGFNKGYPGSMFNSNRFGVYSRAEAGLFYINDEKTFSISGSIHVDRASYPTYNSGMHPQLPYNGSF